MNRAYLSAAIGILMIPLAQGETPAESPADAPKSVAEKIIEEQKTKSQESALAIRAAELLTRKKLIEKNAQKVASRQAANHAEGERIAQEMKRIEASGKTADVALWRAMAVYAAIGRQNKEDMDELKAQAEELKKDYADFLIQATAKPITK